MVVTYCGLTRDMARDIRVTTKSETDEGLLPEGGNELASESE
jgi:hypothetical protein